MPRGGLRPGAGRKKGSKNKVPGEAKIVLAAILDKRLGDLDAMIEDTWRGIEIEKQMQDGTTVVGRLNADPGRAAKLILEAYKLLHPPPVELVGEGGGPIQVVIQKISQEG
jgi:hypothetical protein